MMWEGFLPFFSVFNSHYSYRYPYHYFPMVTILYNCTIECFPTFRTRYALFSLYDIGYTVLLASPYLENQHGNGGNITHPTLYSTFYVFINLIPNTITIPLQVTLDDRMSFPHCTVTRRINKFFAHDDSPN